MENYKLIYDMFGNISSYAIRLSDGSSVHRELNEGYVKWIEEGNTPLPPDPEPTPEPLTPQQKLEKAGLTVDELKSLLGL